MNLQNYEISMNLQNYEISMNLQTILGKRFNIMDSV